MVTLDKSYNALDQSCAGKAIGEMTCVTSAVALHYRCLILVEASVGFFLFSGHLCMHVLSAAGRLNQGRRIDNRRGPTVSLCWHRVVVRKGPTLQKCD